MTTPVLTPQPYSWRRDGVAYSATYPTEKFSFRAGRCTKLDGSLPLVVWCHGALSSGPASWSAETPLRFLARGFPVVAMDAGGVTHFCNPASKTALDEGLTTFASATYGTRLKSDGYVIAGSSMGGMQALNRLLDDPTHVLACPVVIPGINVEDIRANNREGLQAAIETAHTDNATWQTRRATTNPADFAGSLTSYASKIKIWYSGDDPTALPAFTTAFAATVGCTAVNFGNEGHAFTTLDDDLVVDYVLSVL